MTIARQPVEVEILVPIHVAPVERDGSLPDDIPATSLIVLRHRPKSLLYVDVGDVALARAVLTARSRYPRAAIGIPIYEESVIVEVVHANDHWHEGQQVSVGEPPTR